MLSGNPTIFGIDPFSESSTPVHPLGTKGVDAQGRIFRYTQNASTALAIATLVVTADITANHEDRVFVAAGSVGDTIFSISIGATDIAVNEYNQGYMVIVDDTGEGRTHLIKRHGVNSGAANVEFEITPGLQAATTTSTTVTLVRNKFRDVVIATGGTQTDIPVGVTPMVISADFYFWAATGGIHAVLSSGTNPATAGQPITIGEANNGSVSERDALAEPPIGYAFPGSTPVSAEHNPYLLTLDS